MHLDLLLFAAPPDIHERGFVVHVLTGSPVELAERSLELGYAGFEYLPNPEQVPAPDEFVRVLEATGAVLPVVNTGRMVAHGLTLFHSDQNVATRAKHAFEQILDFAGGVGAKVGLGIARGPVRADLDEPAMERLAADVFGELAEHAAKAGTVILLEPAETNVTRFILTLREVTQWVDRVNERQRGFDRKRDIKNSLPLHSRPFPREGGREKHDAISRQDPAHFSVMIDTHQLVESEASIEEGLSGARGEAMHLHLFDYERHPPGTYPNGFDWRRFFAALAAENFCGTGSVTLPRADQAGSPAEVAHFIRQHMAGSQAPAWEPAPRSSCFASEGRPALTKQSFGRGVPKQELGNK